MSLYRLGDVRPQLSQGVWVAPSAVLIGDVRLAERANIWFNAVLRGDNEPIRIGADSNVQESCVFHTDPGLPLEIGAKVTVGHQVVLHSCTVDEGSLIGMGATVLNRARIGRFCIVGAKSLVTEGKVFPDRVLIVGSPARVVRELTEAEIASLEKSALHYVENAQRFRETLVQLSA
ncbi:MAG: gamma carbonic anhydrase family protein [Zoogloeaceae bacterium]|jgi:carbonic anhydrase/acetyltransferase-like protein (isoleucine patch superfamily)|nr:gamma carbonic anhydrase family protein [Zoogloeaceae bacterium]